MLFAYIIQGIISAVFCYFLFLFFKKQLRYSLIFSFLTILLLNFVMGIMGNLIVMIYIVFGLMFKFHSKNLKLAKFLKNLIIAVLSIFLVISIFGLILKFTLHKEQLEILIKIVAITFWSSLLLMFFEMNKSLK